MVKIGVLLGSKPSNFAKDPHYALEIRYFTALEKAGAIAIPITYSNIEEQLQNIDGILIPGGDYSVPSCYYKNCIQPGYMDEGVWFDAHYAICNYALENNLPILGICAGMQMLAIALGGKLSIGLENHRETDNKKLAHNIQILEDSHLFKAVQKKDFLVNSIHSEYVTEITNNIKVVAKAEDGIIEAIESNNHKFALGVQWHPETLVNLEENHLNIFKYFIKQCTKYI